MRFELSGDAGAAFRLQNPSREAFSITHPDGVAVIRPGAPYAHVVLSALPAQADKLRDGAYRVLQEALDVHAAKTRRPLATSHGDLEYFSWSRDPSGLSLTVTDTADFPWTVSAVGQVGSGPPSAPPSPPPPPFVHHVALRYYRLSQLSDDLFDAYRNAYMALEYLVSSVSPKQPNESELMWLKRVIGGPLAGGVPGGLNVDVLLGEIYKNGRLPLFHAKMGATFFPPHGQDREQIQDLFGQLTLLLVALLQHVLGNDAATRWGEASQEVQDAQARAALKADGVVLSDGLNVCNITDNVVCSVVDSPRRFGQLWGSITAPINGSLDSVSRIRTLNAGAFWYDFLIAESISLRDVVKISIEINLLQHNARSPRPAHPL